MFRVRPGSESPTMLRITLGVLGAIVVATGINVWLVTEVRKEQRAVAEIVRGGVVKDIQRLGTLPGELRWQFVFSVLVLLVLIASAVTIVVALRAYLKSQSSLRRVKMLAWDILVSMDQAVVTTDLEGRITSFNPRACELLGIRVDSVGQTLREASDQGRILNDVMSRVLRTTKPTYEQTLQVKRLGHCLRLQVDCHLLRDTLHQVSGTVLHVRDVTDRSLIEAQMQRMERFMGLGTLAAGLHHEIKNPLGALALHVQLLEECLASITDSEVAGHIGVLKTEVTRISGVLESFRDYASLHTLNRTETDVAQLVNQTVELLRPKARQQDVAVEFVRARVPPRAISADAMRVEQVLLNLMMNALDQMASGGTLTLAVESDAEAVTIHVSDTGPGIPDTIRSRVFDPYFTTRSEGMGMGLAVCDKIIQQHGGRLDFDTNLNGTTFHIRLPAPTATDGSPSDSSDVDPSTEQAPAP